MDSEPDFWLYLRNFHRPLCVHHDLFLAARNCLHLLPRIACIMERSVVIIWFLWGQKWIMAFRCRTFMFVLIIICKYCDWRRTDVGPTSAGDIKPTWKRRWADIARPISTKRRLNVDPTHVPLQCFYPIICQNLLCAEIVSMLEATINSRLVLAWPQTYCTLKWKFYPYQHWGPDKMHAILQTIFSNA